jgi:lipopolysaccharide transport system permease protein
MPRALERLLRYRTLLWTLTFGELKARHRQTVLGILWTLIQPLSMMLVFTVVFSLFVKVSVQGVPYALYAYSGLVIWLFVSNSLSSGLMSVISSMNLITKASFPREVIPLSKVLTAGFDFLIGLGALVLLLLIFGRPITSAWLTLPVVVLVQGTLVIGLVLWGSALCVFNRDITALLPLILQVWMFLSPVLYPVTLVPESYRSLYLMNPMAAILEGYRDILLFGTVPSWGLLGPAFVFAFSVLVLGYAYFKSVELRFADVM